MGLAFDEHIPDWDHGFVRSSQDQRGVMKQPLGVHQDHVALSRNWRLQDQHFRSISFHPIILSRDITFGIICGSFVNHASLRDFITLLCKA